MMSMEETAQAVGVAASRISQIESSLRRRYGLENLYKTQGRQRTIIGDGSPISKNLRNLRKGRQ
jgi:transcriptional regulator with XRE-family HTH domain